MKQLFQQMLLVKIIGLFVFISSACSDDISDKSNHFPNSYTKYELSELYTKSLSYVNGKWNLILSNEEALSIGIDQKVYDSWINAVDDCNLKILEDRKKEIIGLKNASVTPPSYPSGYLFYVGLMPVVGWGHDQEVSHKSGYHCVSCRAAADFYTEYYLPNYSGFVIEILCDGGIKSAAICSESGPNYTVSVNKDADYYGAGSIKLDFYNYGLQNIAIGVIAVSYAPFARFYIKAM